MKGNMRKVLSLALLASTSMAGAALAADNKPADLAAILDQETALAVDSEHLAGVLGVNSADAESLLQLQEDSSDLVTQLRAKYTTRLAGIYREHSPSPRLVVRLKGSQAERPQFHTFKSQNLTVDFEPNAPHSLAELEKIREGGISEWERQFPNYQGSAVDEKSGAIQLFVLSEDFGVNARSQAAAIFGAPTELVEVKTPFRPTAVRGSGYISFSTSFCTTGFTVRQPNLGVNGVLTAGHCANTAGTYYGLDGASHPVTFQSQAWNSTADLQWHSAAGVTFQPMFYANAWRTVTGRRLQSSTSAGNAVCQYGAQTGYSCGVVAQTNFQPPNGPFNNCNSTSGCAATYVRVVPGGTPTLKCYAGDSGGPVFISTVAAGIVLGSSYYQDYSCDWMVYTSTDQLSQLGLQLLL